MFQKVPVCMVEPFTSYHSDTNMVFSHALLDVFCEYAALDGCLINNLYAHTYKINATVHR